MATPIDTVRRFYAAIADGDVEAAIRLMTSDAEWVVVEAWPEPEDSEGLVLLSAFVAQAMSGNYRRGWSFHMRGRGPQEIAQHVLLPLMQHGSCLTPSPVEFRVQDDMVAWLGRLSVVEGNRGVSSDCEYAHVWTIRSGKIARLKQFNYQPSLPVSRPN